MIAASLKYLDGFVERKRDVFEPSVSAKKDYKNIVMLAYYRNNLIHLFIHEAEIACAILGLSNINDVSTGVNTEDVWNKYQCLQDLLSEEFVIKKMISTKENFYETLKFMESRGLLKLH